MQQAGGVRIVAAAGCVQEYACRYSCGFISFVVIAVKIFIYIFDGKGPRGGTLAWIFIAMCYVCVVLLLLRWRGLFMLHISNQSCANTIHITPC